MGKDIRPIRIFKSAWFARFAKRGKISDTILREAMVKIEKGKVDADLGGHVIKQRIARLHQGKSGGYRAIIIFKQEEKAFFVYGFAKHERDNIRKDELTAFKQAAQHLLALSDEQITSLITKEGIIQNLWFYPYRFSILTTMVSNPMLGQPLVLFCPLLQRGVGGI